jgi:hypothetical protein
MARPDRHDVDYFPFFAKRGKTLNILQSKYGLEGIGFFTNLMRFLALTPDHYYCIKEEYDKLNFFAEIGITEEEKGIAMIELMVKTGKLDQMLWENHKVIACEAFLESLEDAYKRRSNEIITIDEIRAIFENVDINPVNVDIKDTETPENTENDDNKPQTKVKYSKEKKSKYPGGSDEPKKPFIRKREPENDYERVERAYLQNWDVLYGQGKVKTTDPVVNWKQTRAMLKTHFNKLKPEQIIQAIANGMKDDWVINNGYSLGIILSASVLNRLINAENRKQGQRIANDNVADDDIDKYFREA